ncbi:MAG: sialate O-acetylesterase, partial [Phycisphaerae bacterium]
LWLALDDNCIVSPGEDLNGDCKVNMIDLAEFSKSWLTTGYFGTDPWVGKMPGVGTMYLDSGFVEVEQLSMSSSDASIIVVANGVLRILNDTRVAGYLENSKIIAGNGYVLNIDNSYNSGFGVAIGASVAPINNLLTRMVFQRNMWNKAVIPIYGNTGAFCSSSTITAVEARYVLMADTSTAGSWQAMILGVNNAYSGRLELPAGGWYSIQIRALNAGSEVGRGQTDKIGVGEVFITSGQSNAANRGTPLMTPTHDTVSAWFGNGWRHAYDPQPIANGIGGSPWSRLGDILADKLNVPIAFISVGVGSTAVGQWVPGSQFYPRLQGAVAAVPADANGVRNMRAFLWHQGETDSAAGTSSATYASQLNSIIAQTRIDIGWDVPWGVALASYNGFSTPAQMDQVRGGQQLVIDSDPLVFKGADTDNFHNIGYLCDLVHFNASGLSAHAAAWDVEIRSYFFP